MLLIAAERIERSQPRDMLRRYLQVVDTADEIGQETTGERCSRAWGRAKPPVRCELQPRHECAVTFAREIVVSGTTCRAAENQVPTQSTTTYPPMRGVTQVLMDPMR